MYAEVVYETGNKSVASVDDLEEFKAALKEQHRRAMAGEVGGPHNQPAERVHSVYLYDEHPNDFGTGLVALSDVSKAAKDIALGDQVSVEQLYQVLTKAASPVDVDVYAKDRHASVFKAQGKELNLDFLGAA